MLGAGWLLAGLGRPATVMAAAPCAAMGRSPPGEAPSSGWERSYRSGCRDDAGRLAGGSEVLHLVAHQGRLYAANGYWMDPRNPLYGTPAQGAPWAQVLRLDSPEAHWQVDLEMPRHLRAEALVSATWRTDGQGRPLARPLTRLLAAAYATDTTRAGGGSPGIDLFTRDDERGEWTRSTLLAGPTGRAGEPNSVRVLRVYRDRITGADRLFVTLGVHGVRSAVVDPAAPSQLRWDESLELGDLTVRPLSMAEAGDALYLSSGARILRRVDGLSPRWETVFDMCALSNAPVYSPAGGIRGLSRVPTPDGRGDALLFVWSPGPDSPSCVHRIDLPSPVPFVPVQEVCLRDLVRDHLDGHPVRSVLAAYNDIVAVPDPVTRHPCHLIGLEAWIAGGRWPVTQTRDGHGFYAGALYAVRESAQRYRLREVNGPIAADAPPLVAPRCFAPSPFGSERGRVLYVGGHDCNFRRSTDAAWVFRADLRAALAPAPATMPAPIPPSR